MTLGDLAAVSVDAFLLPAATVALRFNGVVLTPYGDHPQRSLELFELMLMQRLAESSSSVDQSVADVATRSGVSADRIELVVRELEGRGLLRREPSPLTRSLGDRPWASGAEASGLTDPDQDQVLVLSTPLVLRPTAEGFVALDLCGRQIVCLDAAELYATSAFAAGITLRHAGQAPQVLAAQLSCEELESIIGRLLHQGLLRPVDHDLVGLHEERSRMRMRAAVANKMMLRRSVNRGLAALDGLEDDRRLRTGVRRARVIPVHSDQDGPLPLGLGMILSYLGTRTHGPIDTHYQIRPDWIAASRSAEELTAEPSVLLFSNYLWSHAGNLELSRAVKEVSPGSLTIHGGPDTPKYEGDVAEYLRANRHVDIAVHGEGEVAVTEILEALAGTIDGLHPVDLSPLRQVPGISFLLDGEVVRTAPRERLADLNVIPSPFLTGLFDAYREVPGMHVVLETNRGCPYGCTFCDWGTATMARIRKFDLERVMAELDWCGSAKAKSIVFADANFGIFERDVDIAAKVVELKEQCGYPLACTGSYAKNTVKHLEKIVTMWIRAGMISRGVLSLQTMDEATLDAVHRSNIKTEKYDELARQFRRRGLPLYVDLMMGLPGATLESFVDDLQSCVDREVRAKIHETTLLPNSPMNAPDYKAEHQIRVRRPGPPGDLNRNMLVVATRSMTEDDFDHMRRIRPLFLIGENFGVLRHVSRYLRHETGRREVELYLHIVDHGTRDPARWPAFAYFIHTMARFLTPPVSWSLLLEEVRELLVEDFGVPDDAALQTVLDVQRSVLPSVGRPKRIELECAHDYASWHEQLINAKLDDLDWTSVVPALRDLPSATFVAEDPHGLSESVLGVGLQSAWFDSWELDSPVARPSTLAMFDDENGPGDA